MYARGNLTRLMIVTPGKEVEYDLAKAMFAEIAGRAVNNKFTSDEIRAQMRMAAGFAVRAAKTVLLEEGIVTEASA